MVLYSFVRGGMALLSTIFAPPRATSRVSTLRVVAMGTARQLVRCRRGMEKHRSGLNNLEFLPTL